MNIIFANNHYVIWKAKCTCEVEDFFEVSKTYDKELKLEHIFENEQKPSWGYLGTSVSVNMGVSDGAEFDWRIWTELKRTSVCSRSSIGTNSEQQKQNKANWSC